MVPRIAAAASEDSSALLLMRDGRVQEDGAENTKNLNRAAHYRAGIADSDRTISKEQEDESKSRLGNDVAVLCHESANA